MDAENDVEKQLDILIGKDVMNTIHTKIFNELLMAVIVLLYYIFVDVLFLKVDKYIFIKSLEISTVLLSVLTIVLFEIGYRKENNGIFIRGTEIMILTLITLFMPYIYLRRGKTFISLYSLTCLFISIYYAIKALITYISEVRKYRYGKSDIKEILSVHKESYLNEKNERRFKNVEDDTLNGKSRLNRVKIKFDKIKERKKEKLKDNKEVKEKNTKNGQEMNEEKKLKIANKTPKKRGRKPTNKKPVKSMATAKINKKEDKE